eukprot:8957082-Prorocentrum_lima.AAC.1
MTSSLVGSEMCIRDRPFATDPAPRYPTVAARIAAEADLPQHLQPAGDAVSYTHLTLPTICSV